MNIQEQRVNPISCIQNQKQLNLARGGKELMTI